MVIRCLRNNPDRSWIVGFGASGKFPQVCAADRDFDFTLDERVRELVGEENRRMELMRTNRLVKRVLLNYGVPAGQGMDVEGITEDNELFPIPLTEIQLNSEAELTQNPVYSN